MQKLDGNMFLDWGWILMWCSFQLKASSKNKISHRWVKVPQNPFRVFACSRSSCWVLLRIIACNSSGHFISYCKFEKFRASASLSAPTVSKKICLILMPKNQILAAAVGIGSDATTQITQLVVSSWVWVCWTGERCGHPCVSHFKRCGMNNTELCVDNTQLVRERFLTGHLGLMLTRAKGCCVRHRCRNIFHC